jgi:hypothetical protein
LETLKVVVGCQDAVASTISTMTLMFADVAACSRSLRRNQWYQRGLTL